MSCAFLTDLIKLSEGYDGKIPKEIPAHYWKFCWAEHRHAKGLKYQPLKWFEIPPSVIYLK